MDYTAQLTTITELLVSLSAQADMMIYLVFMALALMTALIFFTNWRA